MPNIPVPPEHQANPAGHAAVTLAPAQMAAMTDFSRQVYLNSKLPLREFEGARARIALINGCQICKRFRAIDDVPVYLEGLGESAANGVHRNGAPPEEAFYLAIPDWRAATLYSPRERLAIEYAERFSLDPDALGHDAGFWDRMRAHFSDAEIVDLSLACAAFVGAGRFMHALGFDDVDVCDLRVPAQQAETIG